MLKIASAEFLQGVVDLRQLPKNELREIVARSFPLIAYQPQHTANWDDMYEHFLKIRKG